MRVMILNEAIERYVKELEMRDSSEAHLRTVKYRLGKFAAGRGKLSLRSITPDDVSGYFEAMKDHGLASATMAGHKQTLLAFWSFCVGKRWCSAQAATILRTKKHRYSFRPVRARAARSDDFARVVESLPAFAAHRGWWPRDVRDAALVSLAVDSGKRRGELWDLRKADVLHALGHPETMEDGRTLYRMDATGKTGQVVVRFYDETADLLRRWLEIMPPEAIFLFVNLRTGRRLRADALDIGLVRICEYVGVRAFRFHAIRKRVVTDAIMMTGDAKVGQMLAGHADERMTQQHYNEVLESAVDAAVARLQDRYRKQEGRGELVKAFFGRR